jgi:ABC-2 type transport system ATP-binding protein
VLIAQDISVSYGRKQILDHCSLSIKPGEIVGLVAPNGFGKTTLMRAIAGLKSLKTGQISLEGIKPSSKSAYFRKLFFIDDTSLLDPRLSALDYLNYFHAINHSTVSIKETCGKYRIGTFRKKPLGRLSSGMRQQAVIALAEVSAAPYLLLDEPFNNLDPTNTHIAMDNIVKMRKSGRAILISSHLLTSLDAFCDRVVFLRNGSIQRDSATGEKISSVAIYQELYSELLETP